MAISARVSLLEHFRKLASFEGREDRSSFWPYAALALGIVMVVGALMSLPIMASAIEATSQPVTAGPADLHVFGAPGDLSMPTPGRSAGPDLPVGLLAAYLAVTLGLAVLLYAAAVVRRLHDSGRSGLWGLMPLPFLAFTAVQTVRMFDSVSRGGQLDPALLLSAAAGNILYWAALLALIALLAGASDPGPNRYDSTR
jgi:uncharacterized membrane protein YhaH (DUF805 family)